MIKLIFASVVTLFALQLAQPTAASMPAPSEETQQAGHCDWWICRTTAEIVPTKAVCVFECGGDASLCRPFNVCR